MIKRYHYNLALVMIEDIAQQIVALPLLGQHYFIPPIGLQLIMFDFDNVQVCANKTKDEIRQIFIVTANLKRLVHLCSYYITRSWHKLAQRQTTPLLGLNNLERMIRHMWCLISSGTYLHMRKDSCTASVIATSLLCPIQLPLKVCQYQISQN